MRTSRFSPLPIDRFAVEGLRATGTKEIAPGARQVDTDPDWQPV